MLKIDPMRGTEKVQELKANLYRRQFDTSEPFGFTLTGAFEEETIERDGFTVTARVEHDEHDGMRLGDDEALGEFTDYPEPDKPGEYIKLDPTGHERFILDRAGITNAYGYSEFTYYWSNSSTGTVAETREHYCKLGASRGVAEELARARQRMLFERALKVLDGDVFGCGVVVKVSRAGATLAESSVWGIESDSGEYFAETAEDLASEAIDTANEEIDNLIRAAARITA